MGNAGPLIGFDLGDPALMHINLHGSEPHRGHFFADYFQPLWLSRSVFR